MGLPTALKAHGEGNLALAATHYQRAIEQKQRAAILYQNYGALLRGNGELDLAKEIYCQGLLYFPQNVGILRNYANLLRERGESVMCLQINLRAIRIAVKNQDPALESLYCEIIDLLRHDGSLQWSVSLMRQAFLVLGVTTNLLWHLFLISSDQESSSFSLDQSRTILATIEDRLSELQPLQQAEFQFFKAFHLAKCQRIVDAVSSIQVAQRLLETTRFVDKEDRDKAQKMMNQYSWNASCLLLKTSHFDIAWKLFEWGLRAPAQGRQRWQRAVNKLFTHQQVALWRGESLHRRRLLLLEEQAIGDTMMFLTLLPTLVERAAHVSLLLGSRLVPIYARSCQAWIDAGRVSVWSHREAAAGQLSSDAYDFQCPVGSVCQYISNDIENFAPKSPVLFADETRASAFRGKSLQSGSRPLRIGISWRGGGRSDRIKLKSVDPDMLADLMRDHCEQVSFVNLQYGDVSTVIDGWQGKGLPLVNEPTVNPLKNMEEWLNLVASCDAVISVANTTIHGAGGLNIPTMCLLSRHADWRWLSDPHVQRSYWYPSVGIARESDDSGWIPAFKQVSQWISAGCPMPDGPVHTEATVQCLRHASVPPGQTANRS